MTSPPSLSGARLHRKREEAAVAGSVQLATARANQPVARVLWKGSDMPAAREASG
jgi:hypothetical protein